MPKMPLYRQGAILAVDTEHDGRFHYLILETPKEEPKGDVMGDISKREDNRYSVLELILRPSVREPECAEGLWKFRVPTNPACSFIDNNPSYHRVDQVDLRKNVNWERVVMDIPLLAKYVRVEAVTSYVS